MSGRAGARACAEALQLPFNSVRNLQLAAFPAGAPWQSATDEQLATEVGAGVDLADTPDVTVEIECKACPKCKEVKPIATAFGVRKVWRRGERTTIPQSYCNACR